MKLLLQNVGRICLKPKASNLTSGMSFLFDYRPFFWLSHCCFSLWLEYSVALSQFDTLLLAVCFVHASHAFNTRFCLIVYHSDLIAHSFSLSFSVHIYLSLFLSASEFECKTEDRRE